MGHFWNNDRGFYYVGDRMRREDIAIPKRPALDYEWDGSAWQQVALPTVETDLDVVKTVANFLLDNASLPTEKQTERDQLKTKLNTKRGTGS